MDQGAYSCEAINSKGSCFAGSPGCGQPGQDAIVVIKGGDDLGGGSGPPDAGGSTAVCPRGSFNAAAVHAAECVRCFCFDVTQECSSTELFISEVRKRLE